MLRGAVPRVVAPPEECFAGQSPGWAAHPGAHHGQRLGWAAHHGGFAGYASGGRPTMEVSRATPRVGGPPWRLRGASAPGVCPRGALVPGVFRTWAMEWSSRGPWSPSRFDLPRGRRALVTRSALAAWSADSWRRSLASDSTCPRLGVPQRRPAADVAVSQRRETRGSRSNNGEGRVRNGWSPPSRRSQRRTPRKSRPQPPPCPS